MIAPRWAAMLLLAISSTLLAGALGFQYIGGLPPCEMCYWQRYAHGAVIALALFTLAFPRIWSATLSIFAMLVSAGLGLYHAGVEQHWWKGVTSCSAGFTPGMTPDELLAQLSATPLVRCDAIPWSFLGLSMAGWNALISVASAGAAIWLLRRI